MKLTKKLIASTILASLASVTMADCVMDSASSGWTGSITFHCDEPTDLYNNQIHFDVDNNVKLNPSVWGINGKTELTQTDDTVSVSVQKWWPAEPYILPAGQSVTMQFTPSSNVFNISNFHVGPVTPVSQAHISIVLPEKPNFIEDGHLADIIIYKDGNKLTEINNQPWNSKLDVKVPLSADDDKAQMTISVPALDKATGAADPASFTLTNGQIQSVQINYTPAPDEKGTLKLTAIAQDSTPEKHPHYTITTMDNVFVKEGDLDWGANFISVDAPESGVAHRLVADSFIEGDYEYKPQGQEQFVQKVMIKKDQTTPAKLTYQLEKILPEKINITVSGLPKGAKSKLNLEVDKGSQETTVVLDHNGSYPVQSIPQNKLKWLANASSIVTEKGQYIAHVSPNHFTANKNEIDMSVNYKKEVSRYMVGYLNQYYGPWNKKVTISDAAQAGYNVIVIAFASGLSDATPVNADAAPNIQFYGDMFLAYTSYNTFDQTSLQQMLDDIKLAKDKYGLKKILVSVGGETGGVNLDNKNLDNMAENVRHFLNYYHLDGIDFDLEGTVNPLLLKDLIKKIKQKPLANGQIATVTAAPQLNQTNKDDKYSVSLVTTGFNQDYKEAVESGLFDMLLLQDYNTGESSNRIEYNNGKYCNGKDDDGRKYCSEEMPGYINASFYYLTQKTVAKQQLLNVPAQTLLVMGEPALKAAGGDATVFNGWQPQGEQTVYSQMAEIYGSLSNQSQYGGAMVWSINHDFDNNCLFAKTIAPEVTGVSPSYCHASGA